MTPQLFLRGGLKALLIIAGTILIIVSVGVLTLVLSGRLSAARATSVQAVATVVPPMVAPTSTAPLKAGDRLQHPALQAINRGGAQTLVMQVTDQAPVMTLQEAQQIALDTGYPYAFGGTYEGREITVTGVYGLLTHGAPGDTTGIYAGDGKSPLTGPCAGWVGLCNVPVQTCRAGSCQDTGKRIGRIENRPYWLLDYTGFNVERQACPTCPKQIFNHGVIVVDAQDKFVLMGYPYTAP